MSDCCFCHFYALIRGEGDFQELLPESRNKAKQIGLLDNWK